MIAGVVDWHRPHPRADGQSVTLYEKKLDGSSHYGDPIADTFAVMARSNSSILVLADGVNWGNKPRIAARAAALGAIQHINQKLFESSMPPSSTRDIFHHILLSFEEGHKNILRNDGTTTTLTVAMVCEVLPSSRVSTRWVLCVVSVGDSPCYIYQPDFRRVQEVTAASHFGKGRDPRDAGGCLGANLGTEPDLANLVCCFLPVAENDIVFITSDGISDNFDPVILKKAVSEGAAPSAPGSPLPHLSPEQRQEFTTSSIARAINAKRQRIEHPVNVQDVVDSLIVQAVDTTDEKRKFLEKAWLETSDPSLSPNSRRHKERRLGQESKSLPGKLDHTTIVGYQVGELLIHEVVNRLPSQVSSQVHLVPVAMDKSPSPTSSRQRISLRRIASMDDKYRIHRF